MTSPLNPNDRLAFRADITELYHGFDDGVILFDPETSNTTLFNSIVLWLIEHTATNEFEPESVLSSLVSQYHDDNDNQLSQLLDDTLNTLIKLGFIQRI